MLNDASLLEVQNLMLQTMQEMCCELKKLRKKDNDLWSVNDVADYLGLSKTTVRDKIVKNRGFPATIIIPSPTAKDGTKRWKAKEIMAWAERHKSHGGIK